jgi:hypothetical protein
MTWSLNAIATRLPTRRGSRRQPPDTADAAPEAELQARPEESRSSAWTRALEADKLARLELRMWKAYYRRQPVRLFGLLVLALRQQAHVWWPRALVAALWLTRGAVRFSRMTDDYDSVLPDIVRGYRWLKVRDSVILASVAEWELQWWTIRRELGLSSGRAAGDAIARLYVNLYDLPFESVAEAGRLRGLAAEVRDRGSANDPDGPGGKGSTYWPQVAKLLRDSYRSLDCALAARNPSSPAMSGS